MRYKFNEIAINSVEKRIPTEDDKANYIGLEHLESGSLSVSTWGSAVSLKGEKLVMRKGDVLFGKRNTYLRRASIAPHDGLFSAHGMVLRPKPEVVDPSFFPFFVNSDEFFNSTIRISVGSLSPTVNWKDMKELEFDLPPIEKQRELAELLWAANDLKESYKKLIVATDEMLKAKFREMFGECGVQSEYSVEKRSNGEVVKIGDVFETCSGGTPLTKRREYYDGGTIPWMSSGEVAQGIITEVAGRITELGLKNSAAKLVPANAVVVAMYGATAGKVGMLKVETSTNQAVCAILPSEKVVPGYLYFCLKNKQDYMVANAKGGAQPNISQAFIRNIQIPLPPLSLQQEFVEIARKANETKAALKKSITDVDNVIKGLING